MPDIEEISGYYDQRLALLQQHGLEETRVFNQLEAEKTDSVLSAQRTQMGAYASSFESILGVTKDFAGEQSGIYRGLFAVSKAFAIAEAAIAIQQNIAKASAIGFPQNIPFIAGAIAQGASIISSVQSVVAPSAGAFNSGGNIPSGFTGQAGEKGVEIVGPAGVMSTQDTKELFAGSGSGGSVVIINMPVEIYNSTDSNVRTEESGEGDQKKLKIFIDKAKESFASDINRKTGIISRALETQFVKRT